MNLPEPSIASISLADGEALPPKSANRYAATTFIFDDGIVCREGERGAEQSSCCGGKEDLGRKEREEENCHLPHVPDLMRSRHSDG